ncbi:hypothetical protein GCM10009846_21160 [Agrococcus versicolor]|uniref:DUF3558 domain-containing protein n=1 Tax=Agrococcus versicolor TaxID=501482 RepID=A0ABP5MNF6_9MICO
MRHPLLVPLALVAAAVLAGCADDGDGADDPQASTSPAPSSTTGPVGPDASAAPLAPDAGGVPSPIAQDDLPGCEAVDAVLLAALPAGALGDAAGQSFDDPSVEVERSCGYRAGDALVQVTLSAIPFTDAEMAALSQGPTVRASASADAAGLVVITSDEMGEDAEWLNGSVLAFDGSLSVSITARDSSGERTDVPEALAIGSATDAAVQVHELVG